MKTKQHHLQGSSTIIMGTGTIRVVKTAIIKAEAIMQDTPISIINNTRIKEATNILEDRASKEECLETICIMAQSIKINKTIKCSATIAKSKS